MFLQPTFHTACSTLLEHKNTVPLLNLPLLSHLHLKAPGHGLREGLQGMGSCPPSPASSPATPTPQPICLSQWLNQVPKCSTHACTRDSCSLPWATLPHSGMNERTSTRIHTGSPRCWGYQSITGTVPDSELYSLDQGIPIFFPLSILERKPKINLMLNLVSPKWNKLNTVNNILKLKHFEPRRTTNHGNSSCFSQTPHSPR